MTTIREECEQSFYTEVYHFGNGERSLVLDEVSGRVLFQKRLRFFNEDVYRYLMAHPNPHIPRIRSLWHEGDALVVVEELISGDTLEYLLANRNLSDEEKRDIILQICDGLTFLHSADPKIIHRDLKPSNVMVTDDGIVKIIDYDAAKTFDETKTEDTVQIGTKGSAAPEQYGFGKVDERTDVFALGVLIREMFPDDPGMQKIAAKASQLAPKDRYQSAEAVRRAVEKKDETIRFHIPWLPGFRSGTPWKMFLSSLYYVFLLTLSFTLEVTGPDGNPAAGTYLWCSRIAVLCMGLSLVDLFADWTGFFAKFPLLRSDHFVLRILGYAAAIAGIFLFWFFLLVMLVSELAG